MLLYHIVVLLLEFCICDTRLVRRLQWNCL